MTDQLRIFKALANADRVKIMELLASGPSGASLSVLEIARRIELSQSQTSQHLATLRRAGLINTFKSGTTVFNQINPAVNWPVKVFE